MNLPGHLAPQESDQLSYAPDHFEWPRCPEADIVLKNLTISILQNHQFAGRLAERMKNETSTRFFDWLDHVRLPPDHPVLAELQQHGFIEEIGGADEKDKTVLWHPHAEFPRILIDPQTKNPAAAIHVESVEDFLRVRGILSNTTIEGAPGSSLRQTHIDEGANHGTSGGR
ncbi:hypothetical protein HYZ98_02320 [Candidatus Peregrinibacteria bacterium]|nr:hypothetical protein [Candidatus Peregrinibacteria bacterium]